MLLRSDRIIIILTIVLIINLCDYISRSGPHGWEVTVGVERPAKISEEGARECNSHCQSFGSIQSHHPRLANSYCQGYDA